MCYCPKYCNVQKSFDKNIFKADWTEEYAFVSDFRLKK